MLTKESMALKIKGHVDTFVASNPQIAGPGDAYNYNLKLLEAMCQGIIEEIQINGHAIGISHATSHTLNLE